MKISQNNDYAPVYLNLLETGELAERAQKLKAIYTNCHLCPRNCQVDRTKGEKGYCRAGARAKVASFFPHFGEEPELVGRFGSGTIFLSYCNLLCEFCQNDDISHGGVGQLVSDAELANMMLALQQQGCHNINFVTPTHFVPNIVAAIEIAAKRGLKLPIVYNCGGYESLQVIQLLDGIIDIYMPDFKFASREYSQKYAHAADYFSVASEAIKEMHRQVGDLVVDKNGVARRGLLIRHLVMPNDVAGSEEILKFIAEEISPNSYVNVMAQYRPCYKAYEHELISRRVSWSEYLNVVAIARKYGLVRALHT